MTIRLEKDGAVTTVIIDRKEARNTVNPATRAAAEALARELAALPQICLRSDRLSAYEQWDHDVTGAMANEFRRGVAVLSSGQARAGAARFAKGAGRHGTPES